MARLLLYRVIYLLDSFFSLVPILVRDKTKPENKGLVIFMACRGGN